MLTRVRRETLNVRRHPRMSLLAATPVVPAVLSAGGIAILVKEKPAMQGTGSA